MSMSLRYSLLGEKRDVSSVGPQDMRDVPIPQERLDLRKNIGVLICETFSQRKNVLGELAVLILLFHQAGVTMLTHILLFRGEVDISVLYQEVQGLEKEFLSQICAAGSGDLINNIQQLAVLVIQQLNTDTIAFFPF